MFKRSKTSIPQTTAQRLADIAGEIPKSFAGLKPGSVLQAERRLVSARDARAELSHHLVASMERDRLEDRNGSSRETREAFAKQARNDTTIAARRAELEQARREFIKLVDIASEPRLQAVDHALGEAADLLTAAAEVLGALEHFRTQNGIAVAGGRWRAARDRRHLVALASELTG